MAARIATRSGYRASARPHMPLTLGVERFRKTPHMDPSEGSAFSVTPTLTPRRIAVLYLLFGLSWILFSDLLLWVWTRDPAIWLGTAATKGIVFVVLSTGLVYWLTTRSRSRYAETNAQLQRRTRELSIFHRILRHNLRNIATVIAGRAETARHADAVEPNLDVIERKADRLSTLAEKASLLRNVSSEGSAGWVTQDLRRTVESVCDRYREERSDVTITVEGPTALETAVPERLEFAIAELLENTIVHAGDAPTVWVSVEQSGTTTSVTVADDGPGLPTSERAALEGDVEDVLDHSEGVGLWLVCLTLENAGGHVEIDDSERDGTAVTLVFPRTEPGGTV